MKRKAILPLVVLASLLTACAASTPSAEKIQLDRPDAALLAPCADPTSGVADAATGRVREALWRADRINLANCRDQHAELIKWASRVVDRF